MSNRISRTPEPSMSVERKDETPFETRTTSKGAVQRRGKSFVEQEAARAGPARRAPGRSTADVHAAAQRGIAGGGSSLLHLHAIQRSFGRHDVPAVQAHTDGAARQTSQAIGANAYVSGNHIGVCTLAKPRRSDHLRGLPS